MDLADVDWGYAAKTSKRYLNGKHYRDFREMLEKEKRIDAVVIVTPDHIHAVAAMTALKMGKHVYCEKPLTRTVYEARALAKEARERKLATQMGAIRHCRWEQSKTEECGAIKHRHLQYRDRLSGS